MHMICERSPCLLHGLLVWLMIIRLASGIVILTPLGIDIKRARDGYHFLQGKQIRIQCAYGASFSFVSFYHNGNQINESDRFSILSTYKHRRLVFNNAQRTDEGTWTCAATSWYYGKGSKSVKLIYEDKIRPTGISAGLIRHYQESLKLSCTGQGIKAWSWKRNHTYIASNIDNGRVRTLGDGTLYFKSLRSGDTGLYQCYVKNPAYAARINFITYHLIVYGENISLRPVEGVTDGYFTSGIRIQFKCDFDNKFSFIAFKHNDTQLSSGDRISINSNISRPSLVVNVPEVTDAGVWSCIVKRVNGKQKFVMQKVLEHVALPEIRLVKEPFGMTKAGQSFTLYCIATGPRLKSVLWRKESDGTLEFGDYSRIDVLDDGLDDGIIRNLIYFNPVFEAHQDAYRCVAKNIVGSVHQVFNTIVDGN